MDISTHDEILSFLSSVCEDKNYALYLQQSLNNPEDKNKILKSIFLNYRYNSNHGFRLTSHGRDFLCQYLKHWTIDITHNLLAKHYIFLDQHMTTPYYIDYSKTRDSFCLILFDKTICTELKLSNSIDWLMKSKLEFPD